MKKTVLPLLLIPLIFVSCNSPKDWGITSIVALFALMFILFGAMFFYIIKKRRQADKSLAKYTNELYTRIAKLDTQEKRIEALRIIIARINEDKAYIKDPDWKNKVMVKTLIPLAAAYYKSGDEAQTLTICNEIIALDPEQGMTYYNRGSIYSNMGITEKALADFNKTIELFPTFSSGYNNRGLVHYKMEHYDEAIADYSTAIELEPTPVEYFNRANAYAMTGKYNEALADYQQSLDMDKDNHSGLADEIETVMQSIKNEQRS